MKFQSLAIQDAKLIELMMQKDDRGFFARNFCSKLFQQKHLAHICAQSSISVTSKTGTLR